MYGMFSSFFNQDINTEKVTVNGKTYTAWDTSEVTMSMMFYNARDFNGVISKWNTSQVTNMSYMFNKASSFNQNIRNWNVSSKVDVTNMFYKATSFLDIYGDFINDYGIPIFTLFNQEGFQNPDITSTDEYKSVDNVLTTYTLV